MIPMPPLAWTNVSVSMWGLLGLLDILGKVIPVSKSETPMDLVTLLTQQGDTMRQYRINDNNLHICEFEINFYNKLTITKKWLESE